VLPIVTAAWSSKYENPIFLTPEELREWNEIYDEPEDTEATQWWNFYCSWGAKLNPPQTKWSRNLARRQIAAVRFDLIAAGH
jgi:hypothetical protein